MSNPTSPFKRARNNFDHEALRRICQMHETEFPEAFDLTVTSVESEADRLFRRGAGYEDFYAFRDNGSNILAVAHLDTVVDHSRRMCTFVNTAAGPIVHSGALDDRLGAYTILELLPKLGVNVDILLTTGEESGNSTAQFFDSPQGKDYNWMIEFDRGGRDVVMYQYHDDETKALVEESGAKVDHGSFSDIAYLEHLGIKGFNWGVGYQNYHGPRGHAYLNDYWEMLGYFLKFHEANAEFALPHEEQPKYGWGRSLSQGMWFVERTCSECGLMYEPLFNAQEMCDDCEFPPPPRSSDSSDEPGKQLVLVKNDDVVSENFNVVNAAVNADLLG